MQNLEKIFLKDMHIALHIRRQTEGVVERFMKRTLWPRFLIIGIYNLNKIYVTYYKSKKDKYCNKQKSTSD